jgi:hypothetical protein
MVTVPRSITNTWKESKNELNYVQSCIYSAAAIASANVVRPKQIFPALLAARPLLSPDKLAWHFEQTLHPLETVDVVPQAQDGQTGC